MKTFNKPAHLLLAFMLTTVSSISSADDTEIYLGDEANQAQANGAVQPNVLFALDTSSSMTNTDSGSTTRLDRMKEALRIIVSDSNNVNMGLMRFHKEGGPILYPVTNIHATAEEIGDDTAPDIAVQVNSSSDDASQAIGTGTMDLTSTTLTMTTSSGSSGSFSIPVANGSDDAEQDEDGGGFSTGSSDLEFMKDGSDYEFKGVRFRNAAIPAGATINSASIQFYTETGNGDAINIGIVGHKSTNSAAFSSSDKISPRFASSTTAAITWNPTANPGAGDPLNTDDLASVVQELVNQPGWSTSSAVTFLMGRISGTGERRVASYDDNSSRAPILHIDYSTGSSGPVAVGLRFQEVSIPKGATITSAVLEFEGAGSSSSATSLEIYGDATDHADTFGSAVNNITTRTPTAVVNWNTVDPWSDGVRYQSPSLTSIVQSVVNRTGWCGGNSMAFIIKGTAASLRSAKSYDGEPTAAPTLRVSYDPETIPADTCVNKVVQAGINSGINDVEENSSGTVNSGSSDMELVEDGSAQTVGLRFVNLKIPQGADIVSADLTFTVDETDSGTTTLTIKGENEDNSDIFSTSGTHNVSTRSTTGNVSWSPGAWNTVGEQHTSPDLEPIVQAIVNRAGWESGNAMSFIITGSGERTAEAFEGDAGSAASLRIVVKGGLGDDGTEVITVREKLLEVVDALQYKSGTPILDVMYEAARYFRGEGVVYGKTRGFGHTIGDSTLGDGSSSRSQYTRISNPLSWSGSGTVVQPAGCTDSNPNSTDCIGEHISGDATYITPMTESCQANYQILLSDGEGYGTNSVSVVNSMTSGSCSGHDACAESLSGFLHTQDQNTETGMDGDQTVTTHTIGFNLAGTSTQFLKDIATAGGGEFYSADTAGELASVFQTIISNVLSNPTSFTAPAVSVNEFNNLSHDEDIYYTTFIPTKNRRWVGNLKKYKICQGATGDTCTSGDIVDVNGNDAVGADKTFSASARSFWSTTVDGNNVGTGGAGEQITYPRKIYTYTGTAPTSSVGLTPAVTTVSPSATSTMRTLLAPSSDTEFFNVVEWMLGSDVLDEDGDATTTVRWAFSDALHSRPRVVTYGKEGGGTKIKKIFVGTNDGALRAINSHNGKEEWAFIPKAMLSKQVALMNNNATAPHIYGIDGDITVYRKDVDEDGIIEPASGDKVYIFFGMRRGGRNYYALDVTPTGTLSSASATTGVSPKLMWRIEGGVTTGFASLGQSWSAPLVTKVYHAGVEKNVLIFAGGYHPDQDDNFGTNTYGNAVYVVDMATGARLWWASTASSGADLELTGMDYAIPSEVKLMDSTGDGVTNRLYVGDTGGQVWRIDLSNTASGMSGSGAKFANISTPGTAIEERKFFYPPSVTEANDSTFSDVAEYDAVVIASGDRANPASDTVHDEVYMFRDYNVFYSKISSGFTALTRSSLYNATLNLIQESDGTFGDTETTKLKDDYDGWLVSLVDGTSDWKGEKSLARTVILNNIVYMTTFVPGDPSAAVDVCAPPVAGSGRLYVMYMKNAGAVNEDWAGSVTTFERADRVKDIQPGIPSSYIPIFIQKEDGSVEVKGNIGGGGGMVTDDPDIKLEGIRSFWTEEEQ